MPSCDILGSSRNVFTLGFVCVHVETKSLRINPSPTSGQDSRIFLSGLVFFFLSFFLSFFLFLGSFSYFFFFSIGQQLGIGAHVLATMRDCSTGRVGRGQSPGCTYVKHIVHFLPRTTGEVEK